MNRRLMVLLEERPAMAGMLDDVYRNQAVMLRKLGREKEADEIEGRRMALIGRGLPKS